MSEVKATGVWKSFLVSFFIPVIGGLIIYFLNKKKNKELASISLVLSIFNPILVIFIIHVAILRILIIFVLMLIFMKIFRENKYRYFIPVWYFGLFGAIYSYYWGYKENEALRKDVGWFFFGQVVILIVVIISSAIISYWISTTVQSMVAKTYA